VVRLGAGSLLNSGKREDLLSFALWDSSQWEFDLRRVSVNV